ncbi:carbohydrate kinase family protein [Candidatus Daviesbacteria bacterium]|nr:carbohydrate kinase family protein [Candidatus Daviesbacteria bacterium]
MNKKIIVTGSLAFDLIMDFPGKFLEHIDTSKLHILNVSFLVESLKKERGGNSANMAYTLSLLSVGTTILSSAGNDFEPYDKFLKENGIDSSEIKIIPEDSTATAVIMTDQSDNQISAFYPGAMRQNINLSLKNLKNKADFAVLTPDLPEAMVKFASECRELQIPYLFDPGMQLPALTNEQLKTGIEGAEILIGNDYEMGVIKKRLFLTELDLLSKVKILITTLGDRGSIVQTRTQEFTIVAVKTQNVPDPTGAGDAYRSGFLAGYLRDFDLKTCGQMGSVASCFAIEKYGTTNHKFSISEFKKRYSDNFGEEINGEI